MPGAARFAHLSVLSRRGHRNSNVVVERTTRPISNASGKASRMARNEPFGAARTNPMPMLSERNISRSSMAPAFCTIPKMGGIVQLDRSIWRAESGRHQFLNPAAESAAGHMRHAMDFRPRRHERVHFPNVNAGRSEQFFAQRSCRRVQRWWSVRANFGNSALRINENPLLCSPLDGTPISTSPSATDSPVIIRERSTTPTADPARSNSPAR